MAQHTPRPQVTSKLSALLAVAGLASTLDDLPLKFDSIAWFQNVRKTSACYSSLGALWANQPNHWLTNAPKSYSRSWLKPTNRWLFRTLTPTCLLVATSLLSVYRYPKLFTHYSRRPHAPPSPGRHPVVSSYLAGAAFAVPRCHCTVVVVVADQVAAAGAPSRSSPLPRTGEGVQHICSSCFSSFDF